MRHWRALKTIIKREYCSFFRSSLAYVFLLAFLVCNMVFTFKMANWYDLGNANLRSFFDFHPYLYLFFVPAVGMRMWAEEEREGTLELLLTLPVNTWHAVAGKFMAAWLFVATALLFTAPLVVSVYALGEPDGGAIVSGYIGSLLLAGMFLALSSLCSAFTSTQVTSYISAFLLLLLLSVGGMASLGVEGFLGEYLSADKVRTIVFLSASSRIESLFRGILDFRDVMYFVIFTLFGLVTTGIIIRSRRSSHSGNWPMTVASLLIGLIGVFFINLTFRETVVRKDLTADHLYTLSESTREVLKKVEKLPGKVTIRYYFSNSVASIQSKAHAQRIEDLLKEFRELSFGKLDFEVLDPKPASAAKVAADIDLVTPVMKLAGNDIYSGFAVSFQDRKEILPHFRADKEDELELALTRMVRNVTARKRKVLALKTMLPMLGQQADPKKGKVPSPEWLLISELRKEYDMVELPTRGLDPKVVDLVLLMHPGKMSEQELYAIDQYLLKGGKVLAFVDPWSRQAQRFKSESPTSDLGTLNLAWKVLCKTDSVLADKNLKVNHRGKDNPFIFELTQENIKSDWKALRGLKKLRMYYSGWLEYKPENAPYLNYQELLLSSDVNMAVEGALLNDNKTVLEKLTKQEALAGSDKEKRKDKVLGLRITGEFQSTYNNFVPEFIERDKSRLRKATAAGEVVLFTDTDLLHSSMFQSLKVNPNGDKERLFICDNREFFLNVIDEMTYGGELRELRLRRKKPRNFLAPEKWVKEFHKSHQQRIEEQRGLIVSSYAITAPLEAKMHRNIPLGKHQIQALEESRMHAAEAQKNLDDLWDEQKKMLEVKKASYENWNIFLPPALVLLLLLLRAALSFNHKRRKFV